MNCPIFRAFGAFIVLRIILENNGETCKVKTNLLDFFMGGGAIIKKILYKFIFG